VFYPALSSFHYAKVGKHLHLVENRLNLDKLLSNQCLLVWAFKVVVGNEAGREKTRISSHSF
jgi:hypothetical protein